MGFTYLVPAHLGSPRKRAVKRVCVCVCVCVSLLQSANSAMRNLTAPQIARFCSLYGEPSLLICCAGNVWNLELLSLSVYANFRLFVFPFCVVFTPPTVGRRVLSGSCMSVSVYLSTLCGHVFGTACPYSPSVVVHVSYGRGSSLWRRCSMLCAFSAEQFSFVRVLLNVLSKYQVLGGDRPAGSVWFTGRAGTVLWTWRASEDYIYTFCSIHTHLFDGPLSGTTRVSRYQKGKTNLDFTEARDSEWQWHQLGHMQVCTSDNHR